MGTETTGKTIDQKKTRAMLVRDEGLRLKPYLDTAGKWTAGVGRNLSDVGISEQEAFILLDNDVRRSEQACAAIFGPDLWNRWSENRRLGWINLAFNLGNATLLSFRDTLRAAIREDWDRVAKEIRDSKYYNQVGSRAERVISMITKEEFPYG